MRACVAVLVLVPINVAVAAETPAPLRESFDMHVPQPPAPVRISGTPHLVYELHLTNFTADRLGVTRVEVRQPGRERAVADYREAEVSARLGRPGRPSAGDKRIVDPGMRAVVYIWLPLDPPDQIPPGLTHRVHFDVMRATGIETAVVDGGTVVVDKRSPRALDPPLRGGPWAAVYAPSMERGHRRVIYTVDGRARIPGRLAVDWIKVDDRGRSAAGDLLRLSSSYGYGADVLAVADSVVADVRDGLEDAPPSGPRNRNPLGSGAGNYISLDLGDGRYAFYEHLKPGSITVKIGDRVTSGQVIAALGNSGDTMAPHLHFHVSDANATLAAEGVPYVFKRFEQLGAYESLEAFGKGQPWMPTPPGSTRSHEMAHPAPNAVVNFRGASK